MTISDTDDKELYSGLTNFILEDKKNKCEFILKCVLLTFDNISTKCLFEKKYKRSDDLYWSIRIFYYLISRETGMPFREIATAYNTHSFKQINIYFNDTLEKVKEKNNPIYKIVTNITEKIREWERKNQL